MLKGYLAVMFIGAFGCGARMLLSNFAPAYTPINAK
jgi:hypothetical protein